MNRIARQRWLLLALLLATLLALWSAWPDLNDPYTVQDDFRKLYWMNRFQDPDLYPDDPSIGGAVKEFEIGPVQLTVDANRPLYSVLFLLAAPLFSPVLFNKLLLFPLLWIAVYYLVRIGEKVRGGGTGLLLAMAFTILNLASPSSIDVASGLPRSFVLPVLVALVYYLMVERYIVATLVVAIGGLVYVPLFLLGGLTLALSVLGNKESRSRIKISWWQAALLLLLVLLAAWVMRSLISVYLGRVAGIFTGEGPGFASLLRSPTYTTDGRLPLFDVFPFIGHGGLFNKALNFWQSASLLFMSIALWLILPGSIARFPRPIKNLFLVSIILFCAAWIHILFTSTFALYFPSRYLRASLFLVFFFFTMLNLEGGLRQALAQAAALRTWQRWLLLAAIAAYAALAVYIINERSDMIFGVIEALHYELLVAITVGCLLVALLIRVMTWANQGSRSPEPRWQPGKNHLLIVGGVLLVAGAIWLPRERSDFISASPADRQVLSFIETLPKGVVVGGEPCWLSSVPILTGRRVLWSCEKMGTATTINDSLEAYYAETPAEIGDFCAAYGVDYLVVDPRLFEEESIRSGAYFFEPYASDIRDWIGPRTTFALHPPSGLPGAVGSENIYVIPCPTTALAEGADPADGGPQNRVDITLDDGIYLAGYDMLNLDVEPGGGVAVTLHWQAEATPSADYTVFVHLVDWSVPEVVAQSDSFPAQGRRPTSTWQAGETILDTHHFTLPEALSPGQYELVAGMYRLDTMERLKVAGEEQDYIKLAGPL